ncbi:HdeD family acid-resistance protein [Microbacterium soli]|uniref:HdeD family acid-resistance protein n=1 Tax=Microbacterium soli TaxID=446075 RepID=A0ABP7NGF5_9MICO
MTDVSPAAKSFLSAVRTSLAVSGVIMLVLGVFILVAPTKTAVFFAGVLASYLIIQGLIYIGTGVFSRSTGGWARLGHVLLGVLYVAGGILAFVNLFAFTASLALFIAILLGITWIVDGVVALSLRGGTRSRTWTIVYAILSIIAGVVLLFSPFYIVMLWWLAGISLVVLGVLQIARAITLSRDAKLVAEELRTGPAS